MSNFYFADDRVIDLRGHMNLSSFAEHVKKTHDNHQDKISSDRMKACSTFLNHLVKLSNGESMDSEKFAEDLRWYNGRFDEDLPLYSNYFASESLAPVAKATIATAILLAINKHIDENDAWKDSNAQNLCKTLLDVARSSVNIATELRSIMDADIATTIMLALKPEYEHWEVSLISTLLLSESNTDGFIHKALQDIKPPLFDPEVILGKTDYVTALEALDLHAAYFGRTVVETDE